MAWFGVMVFAASSQVPGMLKDVTRTLLRRPSIWVALVLVLAYRLLPEAARGELAVAVLYAAFVCLAAILTESSVRDLLKVGPLRRSRNR
jgi:hypothetical protein